MPSRDSEPVFSGLSLNPHDSSSPLRGIDPTESHHLDIERRLTVPTSKGSNRELYKETRASKKTRILFQRKSFHSVIRLRPFAPLPRDQPQPWNLGHHAPRNSNVQWQSDCRN